jgi:uridine nucleosidase
VFAILLAAYHPVIELLGISTVHGNSSIEHTTVNAGSVLTAIGRPEVPVFQGAGAGLVRQAVHATAIHGTCVSFEYYSGSKMTCKADNSIGESGLDGTLLLPPPSVPAIKSIAAIDAIAAALLATPLHTSWLVATGTLTNVAQLFDKYPILVHHLKGLSIMGGAIGNSFTSAPLGRVGTVERFGNWTPYAGKLEPNCCGSYSSSIPAEKRRIQYRRGPRGS